jgi:hypothetical protein
MQATSLRAQRHLPTFEGGSQPVSSLAVPHPHKPVLKRRFRPRRDPVPIPDIIEAIARSTEPEINLSAYPDALDRRAAVNVRRAVCRVRPPRKHSTCFPAMAPIACAETARRARPAQHRRLLSRRAGLAAAAVDGRDARSRALQHPAQAARGVVSGAGAPSRKAPPGSTQTRPRRRDGAHSLADETGERFQRLVPRFCGRTELTQRQWSRDNAHTSRHMIAVKTAKPSRCSSTATPVRP